MPAWPLRSRSRLFRGGALCAVALAHVLAFEVLQPTLLPPAPDTPPPPPELATLPVQLQTPSPRVPEARRDRHRKSRAAQHARAIQTPTPFRFHTPPSARSAAATRPGGVAPPGSGADGTPKVVWGDTGGLQPFLRGSVGCDYEDVNLSKLEREHCADHAGRQARTGPRIGPAGDDPRRAAKLAADADYNRRQHDWKSGDYGSVGVGDCLKATVGPMRPKYRDTPAATGPAQPPSDPCD